MKARIFVHVKREDWRWNWNNTSMKYVTDIALNEINARADEAGMSVDSIDLVIVNRRTATYVANLKGE